MSKQNFIDEFLNEFFNMIPGDLRRTRADMEKNLKAALNATLKRMDLVTREEFEVQSALLARTRALVEELENKVKELEREQSQSKQEQ